MARRGVRLKELRGQPAWKGQIHGACGEGDPEHLLRMMLHNPVNATPTAIGTTVARIAYMRFDTPILVNRIRFFGVGATTNVYRVAIYRDSTSARLTAELPFTTAAQAWGAVTVSPALLLAPDVTYFVAVAVNATGTTAGPMCCSGTTGRIGVVPTAWPGNLDLDLAGGPKTVMGFAQFAVTAGALPTTAPARAGQAAWTGGMPAFFLDRSAA
jgi:hypothetical protein